MRNRYRLYSTLQLLLGAGGIFAGALLVAGAGMVVFPGVALFEQRLLLGALSLAVSVGSWWAFGRLRFRTWHAIGDEIGLQPADSTSVLARVQTILSGGTAVRPLPTIEGTVQGRTVRVKTHASSRGNHQGGANNFTIVEAEMTGPTADGLIMVPADGEPAVPMVPDDLETTGIDGHVSVVGTGGADLAEDLLTGQATDVLAAVDEPVAIFVGDGTDVMLDALPGELQMAMSLGGGKLKGKIRDHPTNDPQTVSANNEGVVLVADELRQQANAVAAIASAVERVNAERVAN